MLWTPNPKTIEPVHLCPVCGGIDRRRHPAATRDARRYFSFHRICCCTSFDCGNLCLRITLSGVDAAMCTACTDSYTDGFGSTYSYKWTGLSVDGTYDLGAINQYQDADYSHCSAAAYDFAGCSGSPISTDSSYLRIIASDTCTGSTPTLTSIDADLPDMGYGQRINSMCFSWSGSASHGQAVSNQLTCDTSDLPASNGGTATPTFYNCP